MSRLFERFSRRSRSGRTTGVTVPPMDGALKPNQALQEAPVLFRRHRPDNLARDGGRLLFASGPSLNAIEIGAADETATEVARFDSEITGLIGSGRIETAKIIAGIFKRKSRNGGEIRLGSRSVRYRVPRQAVRDGIVYVTEDRKIEGFFETMSITENLQINFAAAGLNRSPVVNMAELRRLSEYWVDALNVRAINGDARVIELSGGNQQKVVIARSLLQKPRVVIFDEPTKGVDVGAIVEIHHLIGRLADAGLSVLVISSHLPEILSISDRVLVYRQGRVVEEFSPEEATTEKIMYAAVH